MRRTTRTVITLSGLLATQSLAACNLTVFQHDGYNPDFGANRSFPAGDNEANYELVNYTGTSRDLGDDVSSISNGTDQWVVFYEHDTFAGDAICVGPRKKVYDLGDIDVDPSIVFSKSLEDQISSHRFFVNRPAAAPQGPCDAYVE